MLDVYPSPMNNNPLKNIPSNTNINVGNFHHNIVEYNSGNLTYNVRLYLSSVHQEPKLLKMNNGSDINVGVITCNFFLSEVVFFLWKANIECWLYIPPLLC